MNKKGGCRYLQSNGEKPVETGILTKNINETESITLKSWQTAFTIEFVVSNYISGQHNTFAYKLEGYDKEWYVVRKYNWILQIQS